MNRNINNINFKTNKYEILFIYEKELRALLHNFKLKSYEYNGILYGDIVINSIISKYYKEKFLKNENNINFWSTEIDPNTSARTITSTNFDVYFRMFNDYIKFFNYIKTNNNYEIIDSNSIDINNFIHNKYIIKINIGKTITWSGVEILLNLNITSRLPNTNYIEPPFFHAEFTTNLLIMSKNSNGPRFSKNTGIINLDNMDTIDKNLLFAKIIKDICNFKLYIISNNYISNNYIAAKSLEYIKKGWIIPNIPFKIDKYNNLIDNNKSCNICLEDFSDNMYISKFKNNDGNDGCVLHTKCILDYIENKLKNNEILVCPYRQPINFFEKSDNIINIIINDY